MRLNAVSPIRVTGDMTHAVAGVAGNCRQFASGNLFVALVGRRLEGYACTAEAASKGAVAIVRETPADPAPAGVAFAQVANAGIGG